MMIVHLKRVHIDPERNLGSARFLPPQRAESPTGYREMMASREYSCDGL